MSRVFPMQEWASNHNARHSVADYSTTSDETIDSEVITTTFRFRQRLQSFPITSSTAMSGEMSRFQLQPTNTIQGEGKRKGLRRLFEKASMSIKGKQRRHSHAVEERPTTAWNKLKTAASFQRNSRFLLPTSEHGVEDNYEEFASPIPGSGNEPPVIPRGNGGAAARATAAAQNEFGRRSKQFDFLFMDEGSGDQESGIEVAAISNFAEPASYVEDETKRIPRMDFIIALPVELAIQILAHLDHRSLRATSLVSKGWNKASQSQHVWREAFVREKSKAYAMSKPIQLGSGLGLPPFRPEMNWRALYRAKQRLERNWRAGDATPVYLNGHLDSIYCVQFDEFKIITGSRDKTIRIWNIKTYECDLVIGPPDVLQNPSILIGVDGKPQHHATMLSQAREAESMPLTRSFDIYHNQSILCLQYDEKILVTGSSDSTCIVYDVTDGYKPLRRLIGHSAAVLDLAFDDRYIVTCSKDVTICVWDRETGELLKQLRGHSGPVNAVQLRGNTIVSCSGDFKVKLWNIDTGKNIREFPGHTKGLACSQFSDDSKYIASAGNDKIIRIWDANTGECLKQINAHQNLVRSLHIDSVSGRLVSGSYDQDIKVFDMESGRLLIDFPKWHASWVLGAKSDYRRIVSTGQDAKILIMDFGATIPGIDQLESEQMQEDIKQVL